MLVGMVYWYLFLKKRVDSFCLHLSAVALYIEMLFINYPYPVGWVHSISANGF